jgi:glycosyltransferase involved in cell wall biosynthesis
MAGSGPEEETIRKYVSNRRMSNVELVGFVTGESRARLMQEASLVVLPSEWYENCPLIVLEAFACAKPVVAADIGGIPEQVKSGWNGLLFPPGNASELRQKMQYLMSDPSVIGRMGRNGRETILQDFNPDAHYQGLMSIYRDVITRHRLRTADSGVSA